MVDLGQDFDVVLAVVFRSAPAFAKVLRQVTQVARTAFDGYGTGQGDQVQFAATVARQDHAVDVVGHAQAPADPFGGEQGRDGDRHHRDLGLESRRRRQFGQQLSKRCFRELAGDKKDFWHGMRGGFNTRHHADQTGGYPSTSTGSDSSPTVAVSFNPGS